jgi:hypothetical protein
MGKRTRLATVAAGLLACLALAGCIGYELPVSCVPPELAVVPAELDGAVIVGEEVDPILVKGQEGGPDVVLTNQESGESARARFLDLGHSVYLCETYEEGEIFAYLLRIRDGRIEVFDSAEMDRYQPLLRENGFAEDSVQEGEWGVVQVTLSDPAEMRRLFSVLAEHVEFSDELSVRYAKP